MLWKKWKIWIVDQTRSNSPGSGTFWGIKQGIPCVCKYPLDISWPLCLAYKSAIFNNSIDFLLPLRSVVVPVPLVSGSRVPQCPVCLRTYIIHAYKTARYWKTESYGFIYFMFYAGFQMNTVYCSLNLIVGVWAFITPWHSDMLWCEVLVNWTLCHWNALNLSSFLTLNG